MKVKKNSLQYVGGNWGGRDCMIIQYFPERNGYQTLHIKTLDDNSSYMVNADEVRDIYYMFDDGGIIDE